jgi:hypothetical protein
MPEDTVFNQLRLRKKLGEEILQPYEHFEGITKPGKNVSGSAI